MKVIKLLVAADSVHIRIKTAVGWKAVFKKGHSLPLGKGMHHLTRDLCIGNIKAYSSFVSVKIIVKPRPLRNEKRRGNSQKRKPLGKKPLKILLYK